MPHLAQAGDDRPGQMANARPKACQVTVPTGGNYPPRLLELMQKVGKSNTAVHAALEEWGTLTMSGLVLAPPIKPGGGPTAKEKVGTFGIDINGAHLGDKGDFNFDKWFKEAGKSEGSVQSTERLFNSFVGAGSFQLAPEQAALADSFVQKQRVEGKLFADEQDRSRIQRAAERQDFDKFREDRLRARKVRTEAAQVASQRAEVALQEALQAQTNAHAKSQAAPTASQKAATEAAANPADATKQQVATQKEAALNRARAEETTADENVAGRRQENEDAREKKAKALEAPLSTGDLPDSAVADQLVSPTFEGANTGFQFAEVIKPGSTNLAFSQQTALPNAAPSSLTPIFGDKTHSGLISTPGNEAEATFPARARLIDAAGNQMISRIFDFLGNPAAALEFKDKPIIMAAGTIAVNPGWRTWQDYDGQIDASAKFQWKVARRVTCERLAKAGGLFNPDEITVAKYFADHGQWPTAKKSWVYTGIKDCLPEASPLAAGVSPLMERQNIDEASSQARQDEIALFLSASLAKSGQKAAADVFNKFVRLRRLDVKTRSALPVVNSYGLGGNRFGFNVTSRLQAVGETSKGKAARLLEKQNFPILVVFGLSTEDVRPRLVRNGDVAEIWEPQLVVVQTHRWGRQKKRGVLHQGVRSVLLPGFPGRPEQSPSDALELMNSANYWQEQLDSFLGLYPDFNKTAAGDFSKVAAEDYSFLKQASFMTTTEMDVPVDYLVGPLPPPPADPAIFSVLPSQVVLNDKLEAEVVLMGASLLNVEREKIGTEPASTVTVKDWAADKSKDRALRLVATFEKAPTQFQFKLPLKAEPGADPECLFSPIITIAP